MEEILKYTGIGGLAISLFAAVIKLLIKKMTFSKIGRNESYKIVRLSIISLLSLSILCLLTYSFLHYKNRLDYQSSTIGDLNVRGNSNIILNGNITTTIKAKEALEFVDQPDSLFYDFLIDNEGKNIYIQHTIPIYDLGAQESLESSPDRIYHQGVINARYTFLDDNKQGYYMKGELKKVEMDLLWPIDKTNILSEANFYTDQLGVEHLTIDVSKDQEGSVYYNKGEIYLKGYFRPYYKVGGQGYNFLTLKSN